MSVRYFLVSLNILTDNTNNARCLCASQTLRLGTLFPISFCYKNILIIRCWISFRSTRLSLNSDIIWSSLSTVFLEYSSCCILVCGGFKDSRHLQPSGTTTLTNSLVKALSDKQSVSQYPKKRFGSCLDGSCREVSVLPVLFSNKTILRLVRNKSGFHDEGKAIYTTPKFFSIYCTRFMCVFNILKGQWDTFM